MGEQKLFSECELNKLPACTVVAIRVAKIDPTMKRDIEGLHIRTVTYTVYVGGPNPHQCPTGAVEAAAYLFSPGPNDAQLPVIGDIWSFIGDVDDGIIVKELDWQRDRKNARKWRVVVTYDNRCLIKNPFYKIDGTRILQITDLPLATARIRPSFKQSTVPVESARYQGLYGFDGEPKQCSVPPNDKEECGRPFHKLAVGERITPINAAGVPFVPALEKDEPEMEFTIEKPFSAVNGCKMDIFNWVNNDAFYLAGFTRGVLTFCLNVKPGTLRVTNLNWTETEFCDGTPILMVKLTVSLRYNWFVTYDTEGNIIAANYFGWDDLVANKGTAQLLCPGESDQYFGVMGDPSGRIPGGSSVQEILDAQGNPVSEPQYLDCNGRSMPLAAAQGNDPSNPVVYGIRKDLLVYIRYRKYPQQDWMTGGGAKYFPGFHGTVFFELNDPFFDINSSGVNYDPDVYCDCTFP